ncbi:MAG: hypothetical protein JXD23_09205 [Spirochaetales bacterium]|nr:hypothetical protein [Spirochaetales bacterium]
MGSRRRDAVGMLPEAGGRGPMHADRRLPKIAETFIPIDCKLMKKVVHYEKIVGCHNVQFLFF